jgi:hypothetical protein
MANVTESRKQRLRTLENEIRKAAEEIQRNGLAIGRWLCEIRDDELWEEEYDSWSAYLRGVAEELVGKSFAQATSLIRAAEVERRIPANISLDVKTSLEPSHLTELGRLAPNVGRTDGPGAEKDYSRLRSQDIARVLKSATANASGAAALNAFRASLRGARRVAGRSWANYRLTDICHRARRAGRPSRP